MLLIQGSEQFTIKGTYNVPDGSLEFFERLRGARSPWVVERLIQNGDEVLARGADRFRNWFGLEHFVNPNMHDHRRP